VRLPYFQDDKQQDGGSTYVCFRFLLLMIKNGWIGQVKFGNKANCNIVTHCTEIAVCVNYLNLRQTVQVILCHCYTVGLTVMQLDHMWERNNLVHIFFSLFYFRYTFFYMFRRISPSSGGHVYEQAAYIVMLKLC